jgi:hypothetical protein
MSPPNPLENRDISIEAVRRDDRRLARIGAMLLVTSLAFLGWLVYEVFILERSDTIYLLLSLFGTASGLGRFLVWKVRAVPRPLLDLARGTDAQRDAAWRLIESHRDELLAMTDLPATIREPDLVELDRAGLVARVERHGTTDWRAILRSFLVAWAVVLAVVLIALALHVPNPVVDR